MNIGVVRRGEILEPLVYFRLRKTSFMPTLLPHVCGVSLHYNTHTALLVLGKALPDKSLP